MQELRTFGTLKYILHSLQDDMIDRYTSKHIVNIGWGTVDNVSSG